MSVKLDREGVSNDYTTSNALLTETTAETAASASAEAEAWLMPGVPLAGKLVGSYRVERPLGKGGMGEVFLARDIKLGRPVALKLLRTDFTGRDDRVIRFQKEARAVSVLNHPNIITIHEVGELNGAPFIVTEFINGVTLRKYIPADGMKLEQALDIAIQVVSALVAAHQASIVHRDIKPENIMVREDGYVKVLDFGLAKLMEEAEPLSDDPEQRFITTPGIVMGTVFYMSPEQARAQKVDARSDIFSVGIVLYEMLTGKLPFEGKSVNDVIAGILNREPQPLDIHRAEIPREFQWIVSKALRKDRDERYQTARELLLDLQEARQEQTIRERRSFSSGGNRRTVDSGALTRPLSTDSGNLARERETRIGKNSTREFAAAGESTAVVSRHPTSSLEYLVNNIRLHRKGAVLALIGLCAALGIAATFYFRHGKRLPIAFDQMRIAKFTASGQVGSAAISPDGKYVAYSQTEPEGKESLWLKQVNTASAVAIIPASEKLFSRLIFSRDGNHLYYLAKEKQSASPLSLYQLPILGGLPRKLLDKVSSGVGLSPDGKQFAFTRTLSSGESALIMVEAGTDRERQLATRKSPNEFLNIAPAFSPDGQKIACAVVSTGAEGRLQQNLIAIRVSDGRESSLSVDKWRYIGSISWLPEDEGLVMVANGVNSRRDQVWYVSPKGEARHVTNDLNRYSSLTLTADGATLTTVQVEDPLSIWIVPVDDVSHPRRLTKGVGHYYSASWLPDGGVITDSDISGEMEIWAYSLSSNHPRQITTRNQKNLYPQVTPDGRYLITLSSRNGRLNLWRMDLDETRAVQLTHGDWDNLPRLSPDGKWVYYETLVSGKWTIWRVPVEGGQPAQFLDEAGVGSPEVSPDGQRLAYRKTNLETRQAHIVIRPISLEGPVKMLELPPTAGGLVRWMPNGQGVCFNDDRTGASEIWVQPVTGGPARQLTNFQSENIFWFSWSRDGKHLAVTRGTKVSDVVMISNLR